MQNSRWQQFSIQAAGTGILAAVIGFTSSFAIVLQGFRAAGATEAQATSGLIALTIGMGVSGIILAWHYRMPIGVAWSVPGAALLVASGDTLGTVNEAIGAYIFSAMLLIFAGWFRPLGRLIESIPSVIANAMLAGVLLSLCLAPVQALAFDVYLAAPLLLTWWVVGRINRFLAVPAAFGVLFVVVFWRLGLPEDAVRQIQQSIVPSVHLISPVFSPEAMVSIGIPLFIVTMASQNVPGVGVLRANNYQPEAGPLIVNTGLFSLLSAPFGAHAINLAAITAAMFSSSEAHADPDKRFWSAILAGASYVVLGLMAGVSGLLVTLIPSILVEAIAGLALMGSFSAAVVSALAEPRYREAAVMTFLFSASGLAFLGIGGAFWGLLIGGFMFAIADLKAA